MRGTPGLGFEPRRGTTPSDLESDALNLSATPAPKTRAAIPNELTLLKRIKLVYYVPRFSIIIPAYKTPGTVFENIERIYAESGDVEFLVGPDAWNDDDVDRLERMAEKYPIKIRADKERVGKVRKLNELIAASTGEILVFIDNDVRILSREFLKSIERSMERGDFGSGKILIIGESLTQRGARIDYLGINATMEIQEEMGMSIGVNGAIIVAKRDVVERIGGFRHVITEDSDFGCRASGAGFKPVFVKDAVVATDAPSTWEKWYVQRKRWTIGGFQMALLNRELHVKNIMGGIVQSFAVFPFWVPMLLHFLGPGPLALKLASIILSLLSTVHIAFLFLAYISFLAIMLTQPVITVLGLAITAAWIWYWRERLGFTEIRPADILLYYFVYAPIWGALIIGSLAYVAVRGTRIRECCGWKV